MVKTLTPYPTGSKLWLSQKCPSWHTIPYISDEEDVGSSDAASFGSFIHCIAENEAKRQLGISTGNMISDRMTAIQEAIFNPYYNHEISPEMDASTWGDNVSEIIKALFEKFPPDREHKVFIETAVSYGRTGLTWILDVKDRKYGPAKYKEVCGTVDLRYRTKDGKSIVVDWKTGKEVIEPELNPQLEFSARCFHESDINEVVLVIGDIRKGELRVHRDKPSAVNARVEALMREIFLADGSTLSTGAHCDRCPKAAKCPALAKMVTKDESAPNDWDNDKLAVNAILARKAAKAYRDLLVSRAESTTDFKSKFLTKGPKGWRLSGTGD